MCCIEIPANARKCPHCHHFQNRITLVIYHPATAVCIGVLPMLVLIIVLMNIFDRGKDFQQYRDQIRVTESKIVFGEFSSGGTICVMGTVKNDSSVDWQEIRFQVEFTDAAGNRSDTRQQSEYSYFLPRNESVPFKVSFRREFPQTNYVKHSVQVVSAKDARSLF